MFVSVEDIRDTTGHEVSPLKVRIAQLMIETWIGKSELEVEDAGDLATLARATLFQAIYIGDESVDLLEQAAVKSIVMNDSTTVFDTAMFAPYMSPWAIKACQQLSWRRPRSIKTGPLFARTPAAPIEVEWETE